MPQVRAPVSVEAVRGYLDAAKELGVSDSASLAQVLVDLSSKVHPLVLGQIFRSRSQIRFLAKKLLKRQVSNGEKMKEIIDFLCAESGSHDYTINRREAIELGLNVEKPSDSLYSLLRRLHLSYVDEFKLLDPYDPYSLLGANATVNYVLPRAAIESVKTGSHQFLSEGTLTKTTVQQIGPAGPISQDSINDNRRFEGWRKQ
jgi:predicted transcriptional regulator